MEKTPVPQIARKKIARGMTRREFLSFTMTFAKVLIFAKVASLLTACGSQESAEQFAAGVSNTIKAKETETPLVEEFQKIMQQWKSGIFTNPISVYEGETTVVAGINVRNAPFLGTEVMTDVYRTSESVTIVNPFIFDGISTNNSPNPGKFAGFIDATGQLRVVSLKAETAMDKNGYSSPGVTGIDFLNPEDVKKIQSCKPKALAHVLNTETPYALVCEVNKANSETVLTAGYLKRNK